VQRHIALTVIIAVACGFAASGKEGSRLQTTLSDRSPAPGDVVRLDVICDCEAAGVTATVFGEHVSLFPTGDGSLWSGLVGVDLAVGAGAYPLTIVVDDVQQGPIATTEELSVVAKRFPVRRLRVPDRFVQLPENALAQIQNESHRLDTLFHTATRPRQ